MARSLGSQTIDGAAILRCMTVGLSDGENAECETAIAPVEVVRVPDVEQAVARMSRVLPLVVIVHEGLSDGERTALTDMSTACGAEVIDAPGSVSTKSFAERLLAALRIAELRRLGLK